MVDGPYRRRRPLTWGERRVVVALIWAYWNLRLYRYDQRIQKLAQKMFWEGVSAAKDPECPMDKDNLQ